MSRSSSREAPIGWLLLVLSLFFHAACAAPPNKEIEDAGNALKAAKDAGAERYFDASKSYAAAAEAYRLANLAVSEGDYRLALNRALESREHSQTAIRQSSDVNVRAREQVQQAMVDVLSLQARTLSRIAAAEKAGASKRVVANARRALTQQAGNVQEASAAVKAEEFAKAEPILAAVKARLEKILASLEAAMPQSSKRGR